MSHLTVRPSAPAPNGDQAYWIECTCESEIEAADFLKRMWERIAQYSDERTSIFVRTAPHFEKHTDFDTKKTTWRGHARFTVMKVGDQSIARAVEQHLHGEDYQPTGWDKASTIRTDKSVEMVVEDGKLHNRADWLEEKLGQALDLMVAYALRGGPVLLEMRNWLAARCKNDPRVKPWLGVEPEDTCEGKVIKQLIIQRNQTEADRDAFNAQLQTALTQAKLQSDTIAKIAGKLDQIEAAMNSVAAERDNYKQRFEAYFDRTEVLDAALNSALEVMVQHTYGEGPHYKMRQWLQANYGKHRAVVDRGKVKRYVPGEGNPPTFTQILNLEHCAGLREALAMAQKNFDKCTADAITARILEMEGKPNG